MAADIRAQAAKVHALVMQVNDQFYLFTKKPVAGNPPDLYPALVKAGLMLDAGPDKPILSIGVGLSGEDGKVYATAASLNHVTMRYEGALDTVRSLGIEVMQGGKNLDSKAAKRELLARGMTIHESYDRGLKHYALSKIYHQPQGPLGALEVLVGKEGQIKMQAAARDPKALQETLTMRQALRMGGFSTYRDENNAGEVEFLHQLGLPPSSESGPRRYSLAGLTASLADLVEMKLVNQEVAEKITADVCQHWKNVSGHDIKPALPNAKAAGTIEKS